MKNSEGEGWRIVETVDGRFVAQERVGIWPFRFWIGVDLYHTQFRWTRSSKFYKDCIGSHEQCIKALGSRGNLMS